MHRQQSRCSLLRRHREQRCHTCCQYHWLCCLPAPEIQYSRSRTSSSRQPVQPGIHSRSSSRKASHGCHLDICSRETCLSPFSGLIREVNVTNLPWGSDVSIGATGQPGRFDHWLVALLYISPFFGVLVSDPPDQEAPIVKRRPSESVACAWYPRGVFRFYYPISTQSR